MFNCSARGSNVTIEWMVDQVKVASESQSSDAPCFSMTTRSGDSHLVQSRLNCWNTSSLTCSYRIQCTVSQNVDLDFKVEISRTAYLFVEPGEFKCMHSFLFLLIYGMSCLFVVSVSIRIITMMLQCHVKITIPMTPQCIAVI